MSEHVAGGIELSGDRADVIGAGGERIGQAVKLVFKPSEGGPPVPMFTPV